MRMDSLAGGGDREDGLNGLLVKPSTTRLEMLQPDNNGEEFLQIWNGGLWNDFLPDGRLGCSRKTIHLTDTPCLLSLLF